jgi:hypothetical protein
LETLPGDSASGKCSPDSEGLGKTREVGKHPELGAAITKLEMALNILAVKTDGILSQHPAGSRLTIWSGSWRSTSAKFTRLAN